jgi:septal ring factor EnvC (AmiA/AmiB activator)
LPPQSARTGAVAAALLLGLLAPAVAQDIRGLEICTAEKQMERRTACLQANAEFLQQALNKLDREIDAKITGAARDLAAARAEIATLRASIDKLSSELAQMKARAEPQGKR